MNQSVREMKIAIEAFEKDGKICYHNKMTGGIDVTDEPIWDFLNQNYYPITFPHLPELGSKWRDKIDNRKESIVTSRDLKGIVWIGGASAGTSIDEFLEYWEKI